MPTADASRARLNLRWLVRLRWAVALSQAIAIVMVDRFIGLPISRLPLLAVVAFAVFSNIALYFWSRRVVSLPDWIPGPIIALDVGLLTLLLQFSGGSANPFSPLYLLHIALAAVVLSLRATAAIGALSVACYGALFFAPASPASHHEHHMQSHLEGMWVALALTAVFTVYFVNRISRALADRERELDEERERTSRAERLASLATLAAGAAHELSTPLSTIAVASNELVRAIGPDGPDRIKSDALLIRSEVKRCREVLQQMAVDLGEEEPSARETAAREIVEAALEGLDVRVVVDLGSIGAERFVLAEPRALTRVVRGLVKNAIDAAAHPEVRVEARIEQADLVLRVLDQGPGMTPEILRRATEPFFTTKQPGAGMGLGLFLAHEVAERLGGSFRIDSQPDRGTTATLRVPIERAPS
jgi:two-component system sensor histidine kinase RegB